MNIRSLKKDPTNQSLQFKINSSNHFSYPGITAGLFPSLVKDKRTSPKKVRCRDKLSPVLLGM